MNRRRALMGAQEQIHPILPAEYQEVEWIQSSGGQCINTNVNMAGDTATEKKKDLHNFKMEVDVSVHSENPGTIIMSIGVQAGCWMGMVSGGTAIGYSNQAFNANITDKNKVYMWWENETDIIGHCSCGNEVLTRTTPITTVDMNRRFSFFSDSGRSYPSKCRIYRAKLYKFNQAIRDLIPCYRISDNVIGMYDIVHDVFYTNSGTGTFTKGADVN